MLGRHCGLQQIRGASLPPQVHARRDANGVLRGVEALRTPQFMVFAIVATVLVETTRVTNARILAFNVGLNQFVDLTHHEVTAMYTGLKPTTLWSGLLRLETNEHSEKSLGASVDWATQGGYTREEPRTSAALAGLGTDLGNFVSLGEHQFVDCDTTVSEYKSG